MDEFYEHKNETIENEPNEKDLNEEEEKQAEYNRDIPGPTKYDKALNNSKYYPSENLEEERKEDFCEQKTNTQKCKAEKTSTQEIVAFVLSISSIVFLAAMPIVGIVLSLVTAIAGLVCAAVAMKKKNRTLTTAALVISIVSLVLDILAIVMLVVFGNALFNLLMYAVRGSSYYSPFYMLP